MVNVSADRIESVVDGIQGANVDELSRLGQKKQGAYAGDFVLNSQETAGKQGFGHVSKIWHDQCMTYDQTMQLLASQQANIQDIKAPLTAWKPTVSADGRFVMKYLPTGKEYSPTETALDNMAIMGQGSTWALSDLVTDKQHRTDDSKPVQFKRDGRDAQLAADYVNLMIYQSDRFDVDKVRLFRTWDDNATLRAVLSKDYTVVNNGWFLETVAKLIPGGMLSHWRGDADQLFGNVLIPDTIRTEDDSDYGGMLSIGNSEIGTRRITSVPSVFRAICMNGCIWDAELGKGINQVHRRKDGKLDLGGLAEAIRVNLNKQIPLITSGIDRVLGTKKLGFDKTPVPNVMAAVMDRLRINKKMAGGLLAAYDTEANITGNSAFAVMQALTRYGQTREASMWVELDTKAGEIANMSESRWGQILSLANSLDKDDLVKAGVLAV